MVKYTFRYLGLCCSYLIPKASAQVCGTVVFSDSHKRPPSHVMATQTINIWNLSAGENCPLCNDANYSLGYAIISTFSIRPLFALFSLIFPSPERRREKSLMNTRRKREEREKSPPGPTKRTDGNVLLHPRLQTSSGFPIIQVIKGINKLNLAFKENTKLLAIVNFN